MVHGEVILDQCTPASIRDPVTLQFAWNVTVVADAEMDRLQNEGRWPARLRLTTIGGDVHASAVDYPPGSSQSPLSRAALKREVVRLSKKLLGPASQRRVMDLMSGLGTLVGLTSLTSAALG